MSKQIPTLLAGNCPYLNAKHSVIAVYLETRPPGCPVPHYKVVDTECDYIEKCQFRETPLNCPIILNAPKHPPGAGLG